MKNLSATLTESALTTLKESILDGFDDVVRLTDNNFDEFERLRKDFVELIRTNITSKYSVARCRNKAQTYTSISYGSMPDCRKVFNVIVRKLRGQRKAYEALGWKYHKLNQYAKSVWPCVSYYVGREVYSDDAIELVNVTFIPKQERMMVWIDDRWEKSVKEIAPNPERH